MSLQLSKPAFPDSCLLFRVGGCSLEHLKAALWICPVAVWLVSAFLSGGEMLISLGLCLLVFVATSGHKYFEL